MKKCALDVKAVTSDIESIVRNNAILAKKEKLSESLKFDRIKSDVISKIAEYKKNLDLATQSDIQALANAVMVPLIKRHYHERDGYFNVDNIVNVISSFDSKYQDVNKFDTSVDLLKETEQSQSILESSDKFLDDAFGDASVVRNDFVRKSNELFFDALFINRGGFFGSIGAVENNSQLNRNVRAYQEYLFKLIIDYLQTLKLPNVTRAVKGLTLYAKNPKNNKEVYTGSFEKIDHFMKQYLDPKGFSGKLELLYYSSQNPASATKNYDTMRLRAYEAMVLLRNFDDYMTMMLGKSMTITEFGDFSVNNKYKLSPATANLTKTWRSSENIDVEKEVDKITKLAINTSRLYKWLGSLVDGRYLAFNDFLHIIAKIKDLLYKPETRNIVFNRRMFYWDLFSEETLRFIEGKSLYELIASVRRNPRAVLHHVFEILSNNDFYEDNRDALYDRFFSIDEKDKLYSLFKNIFDSNSENSLYALSNARANSDFYAYITLTADAIFSIKYIQYYRDENGVVLVRTLLDAGLDNIERQLERTINIAGSTELIKDYEEYKKLLNLTSDMDTPKARFVQFTIPNTDIVAKVDFTTMDATITHSDGSAVDFDALYNNPEVNDFLDDILRFNFGTDQDLRNYLYEDLKSQADIMLRMVSLAARVVANLHAGISKINQIEARHVLAAIDIIYDTESPRFNYERNQLELISPKDFDTLRRVAAAKANMYGMNTASVVKDSLQKSQSSLSLSRLLGSFYSLWCLIEQQPTSPTRDLMIMSPGFLEHVFTTKEFFDVIRGNKESTHLNTAEMAYTSFVLDFIGGLAPSKYLKVVGNGHVAFLPSVNSDKNTIGRMVVNLNMRVNVIDSLGRPVNKALRDCTSAELDLIIKQEFSLVYSRVLDNIDDDFAALDADLQNIFPTYTDLHLADSFTHNFTEFNLWFRENKGLINDTIALKIDTPVDLIKWITLYHNKTQKNRVELVDLLHYINKDGVPVTNTSLIALVYRHAPELCDNYNIDTSIFEGRDYNYFWNNKRKELVKDLLKNGFLVTHSLKSPETLYLKDHAQGWFLPNDNLAIASITAHGKTVKISTINDLLLAFSDDPLLLVPTLENIDLFLSQPSVLVELNPYIEQWNKLDYLVTQEWMLTTVGTFASHEDKTGAKDEISQEAGRFNGQHKRNVSYTAAMHPFQLNTVHGIPDTYNIATIEDITDYKGTITGSVSRIQPFDGATFVNPFIVILENLSLEGAKAGITKKQFVHFKNGRYAGGGIIKTAGFGLTNDWIRNSEFLLRMMNKMTRGIWKDQNGNVKDYNILKDYLGNDIIYEPIFFKGIDGKFYKREAITRNEDGSYSSRVFEVNQNGELLDEVPSDPVTINSNFELWNFFGGMNSMSLVQGTLQFSNTSVDNVVTAMNSVGDKLGDNVVTLDDVYLALKFSDIHYLTTIGAVKQGAANVNSASKYFDDSDYDYLLVKMYQAGIQLDKEHHADDAELSLMTLVIAACSALGYSFENATNVYNALKLHSEHGMDEHLKAFENFFKSHNLDDIRGVLVKSIVKTLASSTTTSSNFAQKVAKDLIARAKSGEDIDFSQQLLPLSDGTIYAKMFSAVNVFLTNSGIKYKIPGLLAVLTPSFNIFKLHAGRKRESFNNFDEEIKVLLREQRPVYHTNTKYHDGDNTFMGHTIEYVGPNSIISRIDGKPVAMRNLGNGIIQVDTALMYQKFQEKAWRNTRNSEPLGRDFETYEDWVNFALLHEAMYTIYKIREGESRSDYETRINNEALYRMDHNSISYLDMDRTYNITYSDGTVENKLIDTPVKYEELKKDLQGVAKTNGQGNTLIVPYNGEHVFIKSRAVIGMLDPETGTYINVETNKPIKGKPDVSLTPDGLTTLLNPDMIYHGTVVDITEDVITGRNLGAYNVRGRDSNGNLFQMWDIDSVQRLFAFKGGGDIEEIAQQIGYQWDESISEKKNLTNMERLIRREVLRDLMALSNSQFGAKLQVREMIDNIIQNFNTIDQQTEFKKVALRLNILFGFTLGEKFSFTGSDADALYINNDFFTEENAKKLLELCDTFDSVSIGGKKVFINKDSLEYTPYERIMPKTFASAFGLNEFASVEEISNDPDYFIKLAALNNSIIRTDDGIVSFPERNNYTIALKRGNGKHILLLDRRMLGGTSGLKKLHFVRTAVENGKTYRINNKNEKMYELHEGDDIYTSGKVDIIVTGNIAQYVDELNYDTLAYSEQFLTMTNPAEYQDLIDMARNSTNKAARNSYWAYHSLKDNYQFDIVGFFEQNRVLNGINLNNYTQYPNHPIAEIGRAKHASFIKSLDVVGSRTPSQSMQSFMPERVVAFDNPDINTAHVSTMQVLLQGSDYK